MNIGKAIRLHRIQRGLSLKELAVLTELSFSYLSLLERNKRDPVLSTLEQIAYALDVPLVLLILAASDEAELAPFDQETREKIAAGVMQTMKGGF